MTRSRRLIAYAIIAVIIGASGFDIALGREDWPFSHYPMYSSVERDWTKTTWRAYGVVNDGRDELPLIYDETIAPFDRARLASALFKLSLFKDRGRLRQALLDCLRRYEERRERGDHQGPALDGIRVYRVTWKLEPWARNADTPDHMDLIAEVMSPGG
jgi:hypothetical protein